MSRSAFTAKVFAIYLFVVGSTLVVAPNFLLSSFRFAPTSEVWIRVLGVVAFNLGVYAWISARHESRPFLEASVYTRLLVFASLTIFAVTRLASPMIILFGLVDLGGALWTHVALKSDASACGRLAFTRKPSFLQRRGSSWQGLRRSDMMTSDTGDRDR